jgi:hypothetical protein
MKILRVFFSIALLCLASMAEAQGNPFKPVPQTMLAGERLQPPGLGLSIQRPGPGWTWTYMGDLEEHNFQAVNPETNQVFMVIVIPNPEPLSKQRAEEYIQGVRKAAEGDGGKLMDVSLQPSQIPSPGSFRYTHGLQTEDGTGYWTGYLVAAGPHQFCVIQEIRRSPGESAELTKFVRSFQIVK